jgi:hypothetical protein
VLGRILLRLQSPFQVEKKRKEEEEEEEEEEEGDSLCTDNGRDFCCDILYGFVRLASTMLCNVLRFQFFSGLDVFVDIVKKFPCSERERHWEFWVRVKLIREFFPLHRHRARETETETEVWGVLGVCEAYQRIFHCRERERERERESFGCA